MKKTRRWPVLLGLALCVLALIYSVALQKEGYLTYLNSDMASEVILARAQYESGHVIETQWLYSTEIHTLHMNLLYALAFHFTDSYFLVRVIGNTLGFLLGMGSVVYLCRVLGLSLASGLCTAALLPVAASALYASNMTIGGYYIVHLPFAFFGAGLWLRACEFARRRGRGLVLALSYFALCALMGLLSIRYVLCFVCPMMATAAMDMIFAPEQGRSLRDGHERFFGMTLCGFAACAAGYVLAEILYPHFFMSGAGAAGSFAFNALSGEAMLDAVMVVFADFLKLLGWRGGVTLFSLAGMVNLCIAGVLVLGAIATVRVYRALAEGDVVSRAQKRMMRYAAYAFLINLFCFVFISGTYLNRYLILAVLFLIPVLTIVLRREKNKRLSVLIILLLAAALGGSAMLLYQETVEGEKEAVVRGQDLGDAGAFLIDEGYTHGYGSFWHVRLLQERTQGALTFTCIAPEASEAGAAADQSLTMQRWLELDHYADLDVCEEKTFLLLGKDEEAILDSWLSLTQAPKLYENNTFAVYGFASSEEFVNGTLEGKMTLDNAQRMQDGSYQLAQNGRLRMPPDWREAGDYAFTLQIDQGTPAQDSVIEVYSGRHFEILAQAKLVPGDNELRFTLPHDDHYFMIQIKSGAAQTLHVCDFRLEKVD